MTESANLKKTCERCGFLPTYMCQLDVVYIDSRCVMTLCLNCQRLEGAMRDDHLSPAEVADLNDIWRQGELFN